MHKPAQTRAPIHPLQASRWSPRSFDVNKPVPEETRTAMAEAARWAPSCFGAEPWRFVFCDKYANPEAWRRMLECLAEGNRRWAKNAPLLVLVCAAKVFARDGKPNRHGQYDAGAAAFALVLEAEHHGLRCHQMGGFDPQAAVAAFNVPENFECMSVVAIGEQAGAERLETDLRERETAERARVPAGECFFDGAWDRPLF
ncbi:MAG: nitroreductase family protein [Gammaproteobacteria bacterium]